MEICSVVLLADRTAAVEVLKWVAGSAASTADEMVDEKENLVVGVWAGYMVVGSAF